MSNNNEDNNDKKDIFQLFNSSLKSTERMKELNSPLKSKMKGSYSVNDIKLLSNVIPAADAKNKFIKKVVEGLQLGIGNFILGYNIRAGIGIMLRLFELIRKKRYRSMLNLKIVLDEHNLSFRLDAVSLGLFVGYFTGGYKSIVAVLEYLRGKESKWHSVVAGNVAAVSLIFLDKPRRRTLAMYLCVRAIQCLYNEAKSRKWWHFWGSNWQHGDVLLFALSSAQIMYAYVMRPKTLPMSYFKFIQTTGPVHMKALRFVKNSIRGTSEVSMVRVNAFLASRKSTFNFTGVSDTGLLPCQVIHSDFVNCNRAIFDAFVNGCRKSFPLYVSLHFVPTMVLRLRQSFLHPIRTFIKCLQAAMRSTVFLGAFVSTYQMIICRHRILYPYNSKFLYYFAGTIYEMMRVSIFCLEY